MSECSIRSLSRVGIGSIYHYILVSVRILYHKLPKTVHSDCGRVIKARILINCKSREQSGSFMIKSASETAQLKLFQNVAFEFQTSSWQRKSELTPKLLCKEHLVWVWVWVSAVLPEPPLTELFWCQECWQRSQFCYPACLPVLVLSKTLSAQRAYRQSWERMVGYSRLSWQINRISCLGSRRLSAPISWENYNRQSMLGHWLDRQSTRPCVSMCGWCRGLHQDRAAWFIHDWQRHCRSSRFLELCFFSGDMTLSANTFYNKNK